MGFSKEKDCENAPIGERIRAYRELRGWSREALAYHSGVSWSAIEQIESGRRKDLRTSTLAAIAGALCVGVQDLLDGNTFRGLEHTALVYESDDNFIKCAIKFLDSALDSGHRVMVVVGEEKAQQVAEQMGARAAAIEFMDAVRWYQLPSRTITSFSEMIDHAVAEGTNRISCIGEVQWRGPAPEIRRWKRYESLINLTFASKPVSFMCAYDIRVLSPEIIEAAFQTHPTVISGDENPRPSKTYVEPSSYVLQI